MGLERRGNGLYFYRKVRSGSKVRSVYVAGGAAALACAALSDEERQEKVERNSFDFGLDELEKEFSRGFDEVEALYRGALEAAGYHGHRGQWRKRRGQEDR